ncbi:MAG: NAD(P)-dependent oxidoreductase [Acidobacteria bacterium]|nr:NAD(P)-dependent oxidoreductase [Acidobacteriota bacterium]
MSRALVTGGSGFLGSFIADELVRSGFEVRIFDRDSSPYLRDGQEMITGDILEPEAVRRAADGCSVIYHLAALADLDQAQGQALEAARHNVLGTINVLEAARETAADRFILASTIYVYSRAGGFYRCSKQAAESFVEEYQRQYGMSYTVLRYGSLYGPRSGNSNGVYRLLREALQTGKITHHGTPDDTREYIHVRDAARLSIEALGTDFVNRHVTITGSHPTRLKDLFVMFGEILSKELEIDYRTDEATHEDRRYKVTPYAYMPRVGRKLTSRHSVDMGQGILELIHEIDQGT